LKKSNEYREGSDEIGGLKRGGRAKKCDGGSMKGRGKYATDGFVQKGINRLRDAAGLDSPDYAPKSTGKEPSYDIPDEDRAALAKMSDGRSNQEAQRKSGGRTKKQGGGGTMLAGPVAPDAMKRRVLPVPTSVVGSAGIPRKKGGKVSEMSWEHSKTDLKQDKKLAKKHGMSMEKWEKSDLDKKHDEQQSMEGLKKGGRAKRKDGGKVFSGEGYPNKVPGVTGGRIARKRGGKTNVNITIAPQPSAPAGGPPAGMMMPPKPPMGAMPPVPPAGGPQGGPPTDPALLAALAGAAGGGRPPMGAAPAGPPMGGMPMARKAGGRAYKSYKDMDAGAGSGEGRMEKSEIQASKRMGRATGGKTYPLKDGAGGGKGRLEKISAYGLKAPA
jgi:hypothetical protein